uniref:Uncharacterized protein n=1 Tax=Glossina palpalis gambiensis TaxID=67801 RepID=A0A1B0BAM2_9MUSC
MYKFLKTLAHSSIYLGSKRINPIHIQNLACFVPWSVILLISIAQSRIKYHQRQYYFNAHSDNLSFVFG